MITRQIIHIDLDAFFVSVEELLDPSLRGQPVLVGGDPQGHGVVSSASYAARQFGVRSAMPMREALRRCPQAIVLPGRHRTYGEYSRRVMRLLAEYAPLVQPISIDEAFLDVTGCEPLFGPAETIARTIQQRVRDEIGLPCSLGVATNKLVAKIATEVGKPQGLVVVPPGQEAAFLAPLPSERLWGVGPKTAARLQELGVRTIGQLAALPVAQLQAEFGLLGAELQRRAQGLDDSPVSPGGEPKSIGQEHTFGQDTADVPTVERRLLALSDQVAAELRRTGYQARTITLKLRYEGYTTLTRATTLPTPTDLEKTIFETALALLRQEWRGQRKVRLIGVRGSNLMRQASYQLGLFAVGDERQSRLSRAVDEIRARYGEEAIVRASLLVGRRSMPRARGARKAAQIFTD